ncbi:hypothetical protein M407DRAFT_246803 [Tulasnella calospora MUT 4182]|uniref:Uncharacterized protein n=1 Tax=Tulasnella calospora MUT 4182 TaxID=1051891 RepID=A0A0C3L6S2_9AGAM|nr:hypothetical protein M407DRAFT_246803 [Tulasnella calospora MUT 4182]
MDGLASMWQEKLRILLGEHREQQREVERLVREQFKKSPTQEQLAKGPDHQRQVEKLVKEKLAERWGGETVYLSDEVYGELGVTAIQGWMQNNGWHIPRQRCESSCPEAHCAGPES